MLLADQTAQHIANMFYQQSYIITDQVTFYSDKIMQHISMNLLERDDAILIFAQNKLPKNILKNILKALKSEISVILIAPPTSIPDPGLFIKNNLKNNLILLPIIWPETKYICISSSPSIQMSLISELILKGWEEALSEKPKRRKIKINQCLSI